MPDTLASVLPRWAAMPSTAAVNAPGAAPLWHAFEARVGEWGGLIAVREPDRAWTFGDLAGWSERLAREFQAAGLKEGAAVGLHLPNGPAFLAGVLGLARAAAVIGLVSTKYEPGELAAVCDGAGLRWLLTAAPLRLGGLEERIASVREFDVAGTRVGLVRLLGPDGPGPIPPDTALIKFTSGSTGKPKGVALSAVSLLAEGGNIGSTLGWRPGTRILAPVPLSHSYGFHLGVLAVIAGGAEISLPDVIIPRRLFAMLAEQRTEIFVGIPTLYRQLLQTRLAATPLPALRFLLSATAPLPGSVIEAFAARFGLPICQHYGSSETGCVTNQVPSEAIARLDSVGRPFDGVTIRIQRPDGSEAAPGEDGEVVVSGAAVATGYVMGGPPESPFVGRTYRMGDLGRMVDGFLYLRGRLDDMINVGGLKVWPLEIARALEACPGVHEAGVAEAVTASGESVVYAQVTVADPGLTESTVLEHCGRVLAPYKVPRRIDIVAELPRGPTGKIRIPRQGLPS